NMRLITGSGNDTFAVQGMSQVLSIFGNGGNDAMTAGSAGNSLNGFFVDLFFVGGGGTDSVTLHDQGTTTPQTYTVKADTVRRDSGPLFVSFDASLEKLTVNGGSGGNTFNVQDTSKNAVTTLNTGTGADTVNVQGTTGALTVNGQNGLD